MAPPTARRDFCLITIYLYYMEYRECRTCGEYLSIEYFYYYVSEKTGRYNLSCPDCKECDRENARRKSAEERGNAGSEKVLATPNKYKDADQKEITFTFMKMMGWKFNEEKGIWYDNIKKTKDGEFIGVWTPTPKKVRPPKLTFTKEDPPKFTYKRVNYKTKNVQNVVTEETINKILYDYYIENMKYADIAAKYNIHKDKAEGYIKYFNSVVRGSNKQTKVIPTPKTTTIRKKHFKQNTEYDKIPTVVLKRFNPIFTPEIIKKIQLDYFKGGLKFYEVVKKYEDFDASKVAYIIRRTMTLIKMYKETNENKNKNRRDRDTK